MHVTFPSINHLPGEHPCRFKPNYWGMYAAAIREQLHAAGMRIEPPAAMEPGIIARFHFEDDRVVAAIFDYADQFHVDGLVDYARARTKIDLIFKHKTCVRVAAEYAAQPQPVIPAGYFTAPSTDGSLEEPIRERAWFEQSLASLIAARADRLVKVVPLGTPLLTRGAYHAMHVCPWRERLYLPALDQGDKSMPWQRHIVDAATNAEWMLNACGPDNTIDRKVVEACRLGIPLVSNDGLADLVLPYGERFVDGVNIRFVRDAGDLIEMLPRVLSGELRDEAIRVGDAARAMLAFQPVALGEWIVSAVAKHAAGLPIPAVGTMLEAHRP